MRSMTRVPVISQAIHPNTLADREKLARGLRQLGAEDSTFGSETDAQTGEVTLLVLGEGQLEVIVDRLKTEFSVNARLATPRVIYKEAVTCMADGEGRYVRQSGGRGHYAHAKIRISPAEPGTGYVFETSITGGRLPESFVLPVNEGVKEALAHGALAGYPIDDVRVELYDGSYHDVDSSEMAFKIAGAMAFQDAARKASPVLLEPVMRVNVSVPFDYVSDVLSDLACRRARIEALDEHGWTRIIAAHVPMAELFGYASHLRGRTQGRASHSLWFHRYQPVRDGGNDRDALVRAPLEPRPKGRIDAIALPEPTDPTHI